MGESQRFTDNPDRKYIFSEPKGKSQIEPYEKPVIRGLQVEFEFYREKLAFRTVLRGDQAEWDKDSLLEAIADGQVDGFTQNPPIRFPPTPDGIWITSHTANLFDDRDFGNRLANRVLEGFHREPRTVESAQG